MNNLKKYLKSHSPIHPFTYSTKKGFTIIEVVVVFLLILGVAFFVLPKNLESTKHAKLISKWVQKYSELQYMFSVIKAQEDSELIKKIDNAKDINDKKNILLKTIKPYLRITSEIKEKYSQFYMNGDEVISSSRYYFNSFYLTSSDEIVGLKLINENCKNKDVCAILAIDINGLTLPNKWGYDIYGIDILKDGIQPIGQNIESEILRNDCSKSGFGTYCSFYYLIGGKFD